MAHGADQMLNCIMCHAGNLVNSSLCQKEVLCMKGCLESRRGSVSRK